MPCCGGVLEGPTSNVIGNAVRSFVKLSVALSKGI